MSHHLAGRFIEVCDCILLCPCWVNETPDDNHCTGLFLWDIGTRDGQPLDPDETNHSVIDGAPVTELRVVSVSVHQGRRPIRGAEEQPDDYEGTWTVLIVDDQATPEQYAALVEAFSGRAGGTMAELAEVSGRVLHSFQAAIELNQAANGGWVIKVRAGHDGAAALVDVVSEPAVFPPEPGPLALHRTALDHELGVKAGTVVEAHTATNLNLNVASLPGGYLEVTGRSGMTGEFLYRHEGVDDELKAGDHRPGGGER
ncbi:MAG: DUF1326 domain-containing protein [Acidimicrobiales bacterium]